MKNILPPLFLHQPIQHLRTISMRNLIMKMMTGQMVIRIVIMTMTQFSK